MVSSEEDAAAFEHGKGRQALSDAKMMQVTGLTKVMDVAPEKGVLAGVDVSALGTMQDTDQVAMPAQTAGKAPSGPDHGRG